MSSCPNTVEMQWLETKLCGHPDAMRNVLQAYVDQAEEVGGFDAIVLATGLCGEAVCGVRSHQVPLVIPRAHDSIALLLGSVAAYRNIFEEQNGELLWLTPGILEYAPTQNTPDASEEGLFCMSHSAGRFAAAASANRGNTGYYAQAAYVQLPTVCYPNFRGKAQTIAASHGLQLTAYGGDDGWLRDLLAAHWDEARFLVVPPTRTSEPSYDHSILKLED